MPILLILVLAGVLAFLVWQRRTTTLTRDCRWRADRAGDAAGHSHYVCASCGGTADTGDGRPPRHCAARLRG